MEGDEGTGQETGVELNEDELLGQHEGPTQPREEAPPAPAAAAQPTVEEYELTIGGKPIKASRDQVMKWASMGYDAPNRLGTLNKELESLRTERQKWQSIQSKYGPVDDYFNKNPDHWKHIETTWNQRSQALDPANPLASEINQLKSKINEIDQFRNDITTREQSKVREVEDRELDGEIKSIRENYSYLDWKAPDENGQTLEQRVLKHGIDNNIKSFRAAFRDFTFDSHIKRQEQVGMEKRDKDIQRNTKLGLLGKTPAPTKGIQPAKDYKNKTMDELWDEGWAEAKSQSG